MEYKTSTGKCEICGKRYKYPLYYSELRERICFSCEFMLSTVLSTTQAVIAHNRGYKGTVIDLLGLIDEYQVAETKEY